PGVLARRYGREVQLERLRSRLGDVRLNLGWCRARRGLGHADMPSVCIRAHGETERSLRRGDGPIDHRTEQLSRAWPVQPILRPSTAQVARPGHRATETVLPTGEQWIGGV